MKRDPRLIALELSIREAARKVEEEIEKERNRKRRPFKPNLHGWRNRRAVYLTETGRQEVSA